MKNCKSCGRSLSDDALFCPSCGGNDFTAEQAGGASQDVRFSFTPTEIKGKVKAWQIILIALGCIALVAAGIFAVKSVFSSKSYTNGEVVNNVYTNDWAEIKYVFDNGFEDATATEGVYYEEDIDVGFVALRNEDGSCVSLTFQHLGNTRGYSEREGMDDYLDGYEEEIKAETGVIPTVSEQFKYSIAGKEYTTVRVDIPGVCVEYHCIRIDGGYATVITAYAINNEDAEAFLSNFEFYEAE